MSKIVVSIFIIVTVSISFTTDTWAKTKGAVLLEKRCNSCHMSKRATVANKTYREWQIIVPRMLKKGAHLTAEEKKELIGWLSKTF